MVNGRARRLLRVAGLVPLAAVAAVACDDDESAPTTTQAAVTTTTSPPRNDDGVLVLGMLLPTTGPGAALFGSGMIDAVQLAVGEINDAGGVNGEHVRLIDEDEGATVASAAIGFESLIDSDVDAIIGPASSIVALGDLDAPVSNGVLTCSPTASALALDDYPDRNLFFRTIPSDSLQMAAIADVAERTGSTSIAISYLDDPYGRGLAEALRGALQDRGLSVPAEVGFSGDDEDLGVEVEALLAGAPDVVAILSDAGDGTRLLEALATATLGSETPILIVNDAWRDAQVQQVIQDLRRSVREQIRGVAPLAITPNSLELTEPYSANAYDCVNLIALAAIQAGSDSPDAIAAQMASVSADGSQCRSFADCASRLSARRSQIDYEGPSGNTELSTRTGDPARARFEEFRFEANGRDTKVTTFEVAGT